MMKATVPPESRHSRPNEGGEATNLAGAIKSGSSRAGVRIYDLIIGVCALLWLVLRTGTKPGRFGYPCQQSAFATAAAAFGAPLIAALLAGRAGLLSFMRSGGGKVAGGLLATLALVLFATASYEGQPSAATLPPPADFHPDVYLINDARGVEPGRFGGIDDLVTLMGVTGFKWHRSATDGLTSGPDGMIDADDVVIIKVNGQWPQRGGTNTDALRGVIRRIVEHPDEFVGEVVVADNTQEYSSLNLAENNAEDHGQSVQDVVNDFVAEGWAVSTELWDPFRETAVQEYWSGDLTNGYVVNPIPDPETQILVSYPKFQSAYGTYISYKYGVWDTYLEAYEADRLVVINMPVLKTHQIYAVTGSVKNHMGVVTQRLSTDSHRCVGLGGLGSVLAEVRRPDLTILDCIWVLARPGQGPAASYANASRRDQLVAGTDPVALDAWAVKHILMPQIIANGYDVDDYGTRQNPDNSSSVFRIYLDRSMSELLRAGIDTTNDYDAVNLHIWPGDADDDGHLDLGDVAALQRCFSGPSGDPAYVAPPPECSNAFDSDRDEDIDLEDLPGVQGHLTGP